MELAKAYVQIVPSAEGISGSISSILEPEASSAGDESGESAGSNFASKLKMVIAGAGIGVAMKKAFDQVNATASYLDDIDKTSQKLGIQADQYQALSFMAEHCGFSTGIYNTAVRKLQSSNYNGTLVDFLDSLMDIDDVTKRTAKAQEVLGSKVANEIKPFLNGTQSASDYYNQLDKLGGLMSNEAVSAGATFEDSLTDMNTAMDGVKNKLASEFLPSFSDIMLGVADIVSGDSGGFQKILDGTTEFGSKFVELGIKGIDNLLNGISGQLPTIISTGYDLITSMASGILDNMPEILKKGGEIVTKLIDGLLDNLPQLNQKAFNLIMTLSSGIIDNLPTIVTTAIQIVTSIARSILSHLPQILTTGITLLGKLASGLIQAIPKLVAQIPTIIKAIKDAFLNVDWIKLGKDIINGIIKGISNMASSVGNAIKDVASGALKGVKTFLGIHSPSKVFANQVGENLPLGIVDGVEAKKGEVIKAMEDVANSSINSFNNADYNNNSSYNQIVALLSAILNKDSNVYLDGDKVVGEIGSKIDKALGIYQVEYGRGV